MTSISATSAVSGKSVKMRLVARMGNKHQAGFYFVRNSNLVAKIGRKCKVRF